MLRKKFYVIGILFSVFLVSCSSTTEETTTEEAQIPGDLQMDTSEDTAEIESEETGTDEATDEDSGFEEALIGERVIQTADVEYETLNFQETADYIMQVVENHGAYVEYSNETSSGTSDFYGTEETSREYRTVDYTFRVPSDSLATFLDDLDGGEAYKVREQIGSEDVTQSYRDTEARVNVLQDKEQRLRELLEQAESIEDILSIENNLSQTIADRESLQATLDHYDDLVDFSTVYVTVLERARIADSRGERLSFGERVSEAFANGFFTFYYWVQDAAIWLIYALPFILVIGLVIIIGLFIRKRIKKNKEK